uniref:HMA domain-containing protein n=1 Tax=Kalanchoe fedtschenkoi TaxID=63787 RepID=A0A7N0VFD9_KALFE
MGEEEKKKLEEEKKAMEEKASKKNQPAKKVEEKKQGGDQEAAKDAPPPQEVVLKVFMHCEGCAKKVRRSLKGFPGVEDVIADSKSHKVVVKGEKADPVKVAERIQRKSHRKVELISPIPKPPAPEEEKPKAAASDKESEKPKAVAEQEKNGEEPPQVITVVLKVHMHCEACSLAIKKRILRMKGVDNVETDLKSSQVTVVGVFEAAKLVDYLHKRTGKQAAIMKQDPPPENKKDKEKIKEESKKDGNKGGNPKDGAEEKSEAASAEGGDKQDEKTKDEKGDGGDEEEKTKLIELKQNEFYYYPAFYAPKFAIDQYHAAAAAHPPQLFSDENPNACSVM